MKFEVLLIFCVAMIAVVYSSKQDKSSSLNIGRLKKMSRAQQLKSAIARVKKRQQRKNKAVTSAPTHTSTEKDERADERAPVEAQAGVMCLLYFFLI